MHPARQRQSTLLSFCLSTCRVLGSTLLAASLVACGTSEPLGDDPVSGTPDIPLPNRVLGKFDLFNQCWVMKADGAYVVREAGDFSATGTTADEAEKFYMRAANLARYLFYTTDEMLMTASGLAVSVVPQSAPEDGSDWTFEENGEVLNATTLAGALALNASAQLVLGPTPASLEFEPASGCAVYPEMPLAVTGTSFTGNINEPVLGFAEVHTHMAMASELSDGSRDVGPSAGGVQYGQAVNRFGVTEALKDCAALHGENGSADPEAAILDMTPGRLHDTQGWPSFVDWPFRDSQLHQQMYWRWVERAWLAGLRVMTMLGTNIEALCEVAQQAGGDRDEDLDDVDCGDMSIGIKQIGYLSDIQDYIDAQYGGPGEGFFRIVLTPQEARAVIAEGKLAVIPGLEFSNIFSCNLTWNEDGSETRHCTREDIDREIDSIWDLGVRHIYPFHDVDSALGGAGIFSETLNYINFNGTGQFFKTYDCENTGEGELYFYNAGTEFTSGNLFGDDPLSQAIIAGTEGRFPNYPPGRQCNQRDVTDLGIYAIDKIMKKGFILDIDHSEIRSKQIMLDYTATTSPAYPMVSGHSGQGGMTNAQARQLIAQGGIIYPINKNGKDHVDFLNKLRTEWDGSGTPRDFSAGYGADANGFRNLPGPRGMARIMETQAVEYPFQMFSGDGWGPQFDNIAPITVDILEIAEDNGKIWDVNEGGMFHYGMIPDIIEEIRIEGGEAAIDAMYNSAETVLQLWERTQAASADARTRPTPDDVPGR